MTGSRPQLYNGILLLFSFFSCRLVYGTYQSYRVFCDIWSAVDLHPSPEKRLSPVMAFATDSSTVPFWLASAYLASNMVLNGLNFYWFVMMIKAVRKRFVPAKEVVTEVDVDLSSVASALSAPAATRRRKA